MSFSSTRFTRRYTPFACGPYKNMSFDNDFRSRRFCMLSCLSAWRAGKNSINDHNQWRHGAPIWLVCRSLPNFVHVAKGLISMCSWGTTGYVSRRERKRENERVKEKEGGRERERERERQNTANFTCRHYYVIGARRWDIVSRVIWIRIFVTQIAKVLFLNPLCFRRWPTIR